MTDAPQSDATGSVDAPSSSAEASSSSRLRRASLFLLVLAAATFTYFVVADRTTPFSSDARVQAFVLRVAPEITGRVLDVHVTDNARIEAGAPLFTIDPTPFEIAVEQAEASLAQIGQTIGASTASMEGAQAKLDEARAAEANVAAQSRRVLELVRQGVYPAARRDDALATVDKARATTKNAEAELRRAQAELGPSGQDNPRIREALAALEKANFDLSRTLNTAPTRGVVTNLQLAVGQTVVAGQQAMTFISAEDIWLLTAIRENSLGVLAPGQRAEVVLDVLPGRIFDATVVSVGWGIADGAVDPATGLPKIGATKGWLTDSQRFPVHLVFDANNLPYGARYGSRATAIVYASGSGVMAMLGWVRIRLIAVLTYLS
ncbi:HlyD family secretion protein [Thalassobaculum sp.]|uniref:HlyD family secretion protein n=1 Tax=Thalassobaculum sp. TaxID=2022740 RepID=UPI0032ED28BE